MIDPRILAKFASDLFNCPAIMLGDRLVSKNDIEIVRETWTNARPIRWVSINYKNEFGEDSSLKIDCVRDYGQKLSSNSDGSWTFEDMESSFNISILVPKSNIAVVLEGGLVQAVISQEAGMEGIDVSVIDYDTCNADASELYAIPQEDGSVSTAVVTELSVERAGIDIANIEWIDPDANNSQELSM